MNRQSLLWALGVIIVSLYIPALTTQLYFRHDDSQTLLWAKEFSGFWLTAFNPKLWLNEFYAYPGVGGYYRPFESVYVMAILRTFGSDPFYFHLFNAVLIVGTFVFLFKIIELFSNRYFAFLGILLFHGAFNGILYGLTHIVVPFGYFFELGAIYLFLLGLSRNKNWMFLIAWLLYLPATNRQTSMIIIPFLIALYLIDHWKEVRTQRKKIFALLVVSILPNLILPFSGFVSTGTLLSQPFSFENYSQFVLERYTFYGNLITNGLASILVLFPVGYTIAAQNLRKTTKLPERKQFFLDCAIGLLFVGLSQLPGNVCNFIITFALIYLFFTNRDVRLGFGWCFASMGVFLMVNYYHGGYFVEAAMGLIFGLIPLYQSIFADLARQFDETLQRMTHFLRSLWQGRRKISMIAFVLLFLMVSGFAASHALANKLNAVYVLIQTNKNFEDTVNFIVSSLPANAVIYQLTNDEMATNDRIWRFHSLRERAENVKVMNAEDLSSMVKVLDRYDLQFRPSQQLLAVQQAEAEAAEPKYFLVCSAKEQELAEARFELSPLKLFHRGETVAGIYVVE